MRTRADNAIDLAATAVIATAISVLLYTANHLYDRANAWTPPPYSPTPPAWEVASCDHTKSKRDRAPCGLRRVADLRN